MNEGKIFFRIHHKEYECEKYQKLLEGFKSSN